MKNVVLIIAQKNFRDDELETPKNALEAAGHNIFVASKTTSIATGKLGSQVKPDLSISNVLKNIDSYDAVVFIGGPGCAVYINDEDAISIAQNAFAKNKVVAAICLAPAILAKAGVLKAKKATICGDPDSVQLLKQSGAIYTGSSVAVDGKIITGNGPDAAKEFGKKIVEALR